MAILKAQHLAKSYKSRQVVRDVSLSIESGQIVGLLGPNGAGKTTCFYMIVGLVKADQGRVLIDDQDVTHLPMHGRARAGIGYLPQEASIFRKLSVTDNIMAILETRKDLDRSGRQQALEGLLQEFHIHHIRDSLGMSLSGGERRRVEIARALATAPSSSSWMNPSPASTRSRSGTSSRSSITSRQRASACSSPTTTCARRWISARLHTSSTTAS